jgi:hypothetical protein
VLAAAGAFQWSALKYRCLDKCRSPFSFVMVEGPVELSTDLDELRRFATRIGRRGFRPDRPLRVENLLAIAGVQLDGRPLKLGFDSSRNVQI